MKKIVIALAILAIIICAGVLENIHINDVFDTLDGKLEEWDATLESGDGTTALEQARSLSAWWEKERHEIELFTFSPDLRAFSVALNEAIGSLECGDTDNALSKCQSLKSMSRNLHEILDFNIADVI